MAIHKTGRATQHTERPLRGSQRIRDTIERERRRLRENRGVAA